jgi:hypothetical protein
MTNLSIILDDAIDFISSFLSPSNSLLPSSSPLSKNFLISSNIWKNPETQQKFRIFLEESYESIQLKNQPDKLDKPQEQKRTNGFLLFCKKERPLLEKAYPKKPPKEIKLLLYSKWSLLKTDPDMEGEYTSFVSLAKEMNERLASLGGSGGGSGGKVDGKMKEKSSKEDNITLERASSEFKLFCEQHRPGIKKKNPNFGAKEVSKEISELWRKRKSDEEERRDE